MMFRIILIVLVFYKVNSLDILDDRFSCIDQQGNSVDWFIIFLFANSTSPDKKLSFSYIDSYKKEFVFNKYVKGNFPPIEMSKQINLSETNKSFNHFIWNDDDDSSQFLQRNLNSNDKYDNKISLNLTIDNILNHHKLEQAQSKAHSKGFLVYDNDGGYIVSHSLPRFPLIFNDSTISEDFPTNAGAYSQHFLCISLDKDNIYKLARQLNIIIPNLYSQTLTDNVDFPSHPEILKLIRNRYNSSHPNYENIIISSKESQNFDIFSKGRNYSFIPWDYNIPLYYNSSFLVETWTKPSRLPNICDNKIYNVYNVLKLSFNNSINFTCFNEHSKWGVSINPVSNREENIVCFGDLNRTFSQKNRTGLTICFRNKGISSYLQTAVKDYEKCQNKTEKIY